MSLTVTTDFLLGGGGGCFRLLSGWCDRPGVRCHVLKYWFCFENTFLSDMPLRPGFQWFGRFVGLNYVWCIHYNTQETRSSNQAHDKLHFKTSDWYRRLICFPHSWLVRFNNSETYLPHLKQVFFSIILLSTDISTDMSFINRIPHWVRGSAPGLGGLKETKMFLPHPRGKVSIVGSLRDREVACSASDRQGSNFESCVWRTVSSQSSHHPQEVLLAQFSLYVHKGGLKPDSFHFIFITALHIMACKQKFSNNWSTRYI